MEIRKPNLNNLTEDGVPEDFSNSMGLFNRLLDENKLPFCPRKTKITVEEVKNLWVPAAKNNITILAYNNSKLVASGTLFVDSESNQYAKESGRGNEYALTYDPEYPESVKAILEEVIEEAKAKNIQFTAHVSTEDEVELKAFEELGYKPTQTIENYERYAKAGVISKVYEYII